MWAEERKKSRASSACKGKGRRRVDRRKVLESVDLRKRRVGGRKRGDVHSGFKGGGGAGTRK